MIAVIRQVRYKYMLLTFKDENFDLSTAELIDRKFLTKEKAREYAKKYKIDIYEEEL